MNRYVKSVYPRVVLPDKITIYFHIFRFIMSSSKARKAIAWALRGTTSDVESVIAKVSRGINAVPALAQKVEKGEIM